MKTLISIILLIILSLSASYGQSRSQRVLLKKQYISTYKWEGVTYSGIAIIGVAPTQDEAKAIIQKYTKKYKNTSKRMIYHSIKLEEVLHLGDDDYYEVFRKRCPPGYRFLSSRDIAAIDIIDREGMRPGILYYKQGTKKNYKETKAYLENLYYNINPYRINTMLVLSNN